MPSIPSNRLLRWSRLIISKVLIIISSCTSSSNRLRKSRLVLYHLALRIWWLPRTSCINYRMIWHTWCVGIDVVEKEKLDRHATWRRRDFKIKKVNTKFNVVPPIKQIVCTSMGEREENLLNFERVQWETLTPLAKKIYKPFDGRLEYWFLMAKTSLTNLFFLDSHLEYIEGHIRSYL